MLAASRRRRAVVLLVSIAVLSVLAILATVFTTMSRIERTVARNYVDVVRAKLLAQAGIEVGLETLRPTTTALNSMTYYGEDINADGVLQAAENVYPRGNPTAPDTQRCPLSYALRPSLFADFDGNGVPDLLTIRDTSAPGGTRNVGYSGRLAGTYTGIGDTYTLRIIDENGKISVNDVMLDQSGNIVEPNTRTARVINTLARTLGLTGNEGTLIANWRGANYPLTLTRTVNPGGWQEIQELRGGYPSVQNVSDAIPATSFRVLKDFLTTSAWVDYSTVLPKPQTFNSIVPTMTYNLTMAPAGPPGPDNKDKYDFRYRLEPRAPVDMNTAPREVLIACVADLAANYVGIVAGSHNRSVAEMFQRYPISIPAFSGANSVPDRIAREIIAYRSGASGPIDTWEEFNEFVDLRIVGTGILNEQQGYVLKTAANPNTILKKANPDLSARQRTASSPIDIDKTDLSVYSTEFCFGPMGTFELSSYGRVCDLNNNVVAEYELRTAVKAFDVIRHTTARDFRRTSVSFSTQYIATLPDSVPDHLSGVSGPPFGEDSESPAGGPDVSSEDSRWAIDGGMTERTRDPQTFDWYLQPSSVPNLSGGGVVARNAAAPSPTGRLITRQREDRSLYGQPAAGESGAGDRLKGDIFGDGVYTGCDKYKALTYALPYPIATASQGSGGPEGSVEWWSKPILDSVGGNRSRVRRGFAWARQSFGTTTCDWTVWQAGPGGVTPSGWYLRTTLSPYAEQWNSLVMDNTLTAVGSVSLNLNGISFGGFFRAPVNEKYGTLYWGRGSMNRDLYAGLWHHFLIGWRDTGWYHEPRVYVDGFQQTFPNSVRWGAPGSGFVTYPAAVAFGNMVWFTIWWDRWDDFNQSLMDFSSSSHGINPDAGGYFGDDQDLFLSGTTDGARIRPILQAPPQGQMARLNPGLNAQYGGRVDRVNDPPGPSGPRAQKQMPLGSNLFVRTVEFTRYRPRMRFDGQPIRDQDRPRIDFNYGIVNSGFPYTLPSNPDRPGAPDQSPGKRSAVNFTLAPNDVFQYRARFNDGSVFPLRESAYFDDMSLTYYDPSTSVQFVSWYVVTNEE